MKSVIYIGGFNLPDKNAAAQRVIAVSRIFLKLGYRVTLVGLSPDKSCCNKLFDFSGLKCINLPYPKSLRQWWKYLFSIKQYIPFITEQTEFVVAYNYPAIALSNLIKRNSKNGIRTYSDCTEWYEPKGNIFFRIIKKWDVRRRMYNVQCKLDGVISISRYLYDFYKQRKVNTILLPPLVDKEEEKWNQIETNRKKVDNTVRILYAGSPGGMKDRLDVVLNALSGLKTERAIIFDIVGLTKNQYIKKYAKDNEMRIPEFVTFYGRLPHKTVIKMLKDSDFQMFFREDNIVTRAGFPTKFAETISAKTIPVTSHTSNIEDYLIDGYNGFFIDIETVESMKHKLEIILSLTREEIDVIKEHIDENTFDYHQYVNEIKTFISV